MTNTKLSPDIVGRLRELHTEMRISIGGIASEAADEIERLRSVAQIPTGIEAAENGVQFAAPVQTPGMDEMEAALRDAQAFISTALVGDINPTISKKALMQRIDAALSSVPLAQASRGHWAIEESTPNDGFECYFLLRDGITVGEFSGRQTEQRSRHMQDLVNAANRGSALSSTHAAPLIVWPSTGSFLGYRDASGNEMHCRHMTCPHEIDCRKRCICPTAVTSKQGNTP